MLAGSECGGVIRCARSFGYRMRWHATSSMGSAWEEKDWPGKAMFAFESWVHLLRAITTSVTPPDDELSGASIAAKLTQGTGHSQAAYTCLSPSHPATQPSSVTYDSDGHDDGDE